MSARTPSLVEQGRQLTRLRTRIEAILDEAEDRALAQPRHADAFRAQAQAEAAPLIAQGAALRDAIVLRARNRARMSWRVVYAACACIAALLAWWWLRG